MCGGLCVFSRKQPGVLDIDLQANKVRKSFMSQYRITVLAGDCIGKEVMPEGLTVLHAAAKVQCLL